MRAAVLNVNPPETRGSAFAILVFLDSLGKGLGPLGAARLSVEQGRVRAFTTCICVWAISAGLQAGLAITLRRDEAGLQSRLRHAKLLGVTEDIGFDDGRRVHAAADAPIPMHVRGESTQALVTQEDA